MYFVCTDVVKHPGTIIMIFKPEPSVSGDKLTAYEFKAATCTGAKLVAVDPYGVITILYDKTTEVPTLSNVAVLIDHDDVTNLGVSASDAGLYEPGTTLAEAS